MSAASRAREAARRQALYDLRYRRGFPTWDAFRAWQRAQLSHLCGPWSPLRWTPGQLARPLMRGLYPWLDEQLAPSGALPYQIDAPLSPEPPLP